MALMALEALMALMALEALRILSLYKQFYYNNKSLNNNKLDGMTAQIVQSYHFH